MSSSNNPPLLSISSHPLFSTLLSFFALILLHFPRLLWRLLFSPVFLLAGFLFLSLLRLGATQRHQTKDKSNQSQSQSQSQTISEIECTESTSDDAVLEAVSHEGSSEGSAVSRCAGFEDSFVQWNVRAPLEVIYEEYEGEDHDKDVSNESDPEEPRQVRIGIERYPSLSLYYPETDSDSSSEEDEFPVAGAWDSVDDKACFMWDDDEDERDELIEIALDKTKKKPSEAEFELEEDNLIEIDISPTKIHEFPDLK